MQTVLAAVAELERETIAERVQSGRLARAPTWAARYGASSACGARGAILQAIAPTLDAAGLPTPRGGQHWHPSTVHGISENPIYWGHATWGNNHAEETRGRWLRR